MDNNASQKLLNNIIGKNKNNNIIYKKIIPNDNYDELKLNNNSKIDNVCINTPNKKSIINNDNDAIEIMSDYLKNRNDYMEVISQIIYKINEK